MARLRCEFCGGSVIEGSCLSCSRESRPAIPINEMGSAAADGIGRTIRALRRLFQEARETIEEARQLLEVATACGHPVPEEQRRLISRLAGDPRPRVQKRRPYTPVRCSAYTDEDGKEWPGCGRELGSGGALGRHRPACPARNQ